MDKPIKVAMYSQTAGCRLSPEIYKNYRYELEEFDTVEEAIQWVTNNTFVKDQRLAPDEHNGGGCQIQIEENKDGKLTVLHFRKRNTSTWPPLPPAPTITP